MAMVTAVCDAGAPTPLCFSERSGCAARGSLGERVKAAIPSAARRSSSVGPEEAHDDEKAGASGVTRPLILLTATRARFRSSAARSRSAQRLQETRMCLIF